MPFVSERQRRLFQAAKKDPKLRQEQGLSDRDVRRMTRHDKAGKLPERSSGEAVQAGKETRAALRRQRRRKREEER